MAKKRWFKWVVEVEVDRTWVEDGFDLDKERAKRLLEEALPYSYGYETRARVLKAPNAEEIAHVQGTHTKRCPKDCNEAET